MKRLLSLSLIFTLIFALVAPNLSFAHSLDQDELNEYLEYIGVSEEWLEDYLSQWEYNLSDFYDIDELEDFLGDPLTEEGYYELLEYYEITEDEFLALLDETGYTMEDFVFYFDLDAFLWEYYGDDWYEEEFIDLTGYFLEFKLGTQDLDRLIEHYFKVRDNNPHLSADLTALKERGFAFRDGEFKSITELTAHEIAELFSIGEKAIELLDLQPQYFVDKAGQDKQPVDLAALAKTGIEKGYKLRVELYNKEGDFLASFYITPEMFNSHFVKNILEEVDEIGKVVEETVNETPVAVEKPSKQAPTSDGSGSNAPTSGTTNTSTEKLTKTVDGAKMPMTSSYYPLYALLGLGLMASGLFVFRRLMKKEAV